MLGFGKCEMQCVRLTRLGGNSYTLNSSSTRICEQLTCMADILIHSMTGVSAIYTIYFSDSIPAS